MNDEEKQQKIVEYLNRLLSGMYFVGFEFDTSFTLKFYLIDTRLSTDIKTPRNIELRLLGDWWFYSKEIWNKRLSFLERLEVVDINEPFQAFELAYHRWCENSEISAVSIIKEILIISFINGRQLCISCSPIEGESWVLLGYDSIMHKDGSLVNNNICSVTCEGGEFYIYEYPSVIR